MFCLHDVRRRFGPNAVYFQRPMAHHTRDYTLIIPPRLMPIHPNLAASMFKAAYGVGCSPFANMPMQPATDIAAVDFYVHLL